MGEALGGLFLLPGKGGGLVSLEDRQELARDGYGPNWYIREQGLEYMVAPVKKPKLDQNGRVVLPDDGRSYTYLQNYGDGRYQLIQMKMRRPQPKAEDVEIQHNDEKLDNNIQRSRAVINGLGMCNPWEWFITLTVDPKKYDRTDLNKYHKGFTQFLRDERKRIGKDTKYLLVPEQHKKGGWHEHGLLQDLPIDELRPFTLDEKLPHYIRGKLKEGLLVYDWPRYRKRFGFCDIEPVYCQEAVAHYMTKYVSKTLAKDVRQLGAHTYYASKGLERPYTMAEGEGNLQLDGTGAGTRFFENEFCRKRWFYGDSGLAQALEYIQAGTTAEMQTQREGGCKTSNVLQ